MFTSKNPITVIAYGSSDAHAYRLCLEACDYKVEVIWVGSHQELLDVLSNGEATSETVVIDSHGDPAIGFVVDGDGSFTFEQIAASQGLLGKSVISTACYSGTNLFLESFKRAGVGRYIAPINGVSGPETIVFLTELFYGLHKTKFHPDSTASTWEEELAKIQLSEDWATIN